MAQGGGERVLQTERVTPQPGARRGTEGHSEQLEQCGQRLKSLVDLASVGDRVSEDRGQLSGAAQGLRE